MSVNTWARIGLLHRRQFRHFLNSFNIKFTESKTLVDSVFYFNGIDQKQYNLVKSYIKELSTV